MRLIGLLFRKNIGQKTIIWRKDLPIHFFTEAAIVLSE